MAAAIVRQAWPWAGADQPVRPPAPSAWARALVLAAAVGLLPGCAVVAVVDLAATAAVKTVGLAADAAVGAVKVTGRAVGAVVDAVTPDAAPTADAAAKK